MSYFVRISGKIFGPFDETQLLEMKSKGKISRMTEVSENKRDWQPAETLMFLYVYSEPAAPPSINDLVGRFRRANAARSDDLLADSHEDQLEIHRTPDTGLKFEIRLDGKRVTVSQHELFKLARIGSVLPDDLVTVDGTKVFADTINGIDFGANIPLAIQKPNTVQEDKSSKLSDYKKHNTLDSFKAAASSESDDELPCKPWAFLSLSGLFRTPEGSYSISERIGMVSSMLVILCLIGAGIFFMTNEGNKYGTVNIEGTVTLDGLPISGVNVILHPREKSGSVAGGITRKDGTFTVTTDIVIDPQDPLRGTVPMVRGVLPGVYDVTFYKLKDSNPGIQTLGNRLVAEYEVPQRYEDVKTSEIESIQINREKRTFTFALTTAESGT